MELALYSPGLGYYSGGKRVLGQVPQDGSDFVTAPELTPLFGETLAKQVAQALDATGTDEIWEFGAGTGALAEQLMRALGDRIKRYTIVDLSGSLRDRQHQRMIKTCPNWLTRWCGADSQPGTVQRRGGRQRVLDAMPVKLLFWTGQEWLERGVGLTRTTPPKHRPSSGWTNPPHLAAAHPANTPTATSRPTPWLKPMPRQKPSWRHWPQRMGTGDAFFLDYGFPEGEFTLPQRRGGTLMCHQGHQSDPDPLSAVGEKTSPRT